MSLTRFIHRTALAGIAGVTACVVCPASSHAANLLAGFTESIFAQGIGNATAMEFAPDGRIFVCEQNGALRVVKNGALLPTAFTSLAVDASGECGLLGVTFDHNFATNGYVYVYHTVPVGGEGNAAAFNRVTRFTANGDTAVAGSAVTIDSLDPLSGATNHNGGSIHFGADGKLYIGVGENANPGNSQLLTNRLGKILRLNADGTIPNDNPTSFAGISGVTTGANQAIWAVGLRNPFTTAFQPGTGLFYINDVGQDTFEEVDRGAAGANYGWGSGTGANEGPFTASGPLSAYTPPVISYPHAGGNASISGGAFYNPATSTFPSTYAGDYFYADYVNGWIRSIDSGVASPSSSLFATNIANPVDLKVGADGSLYYLARGTGTIGRISAIVSAPEPSCFALLLMGCVGARCFKTRRRLLS